MGLKSLYEQERIKFALGNASRDKTSQAFSVKAHYFFGLNR
ncbi:hypothetical protein IGI52_001648 [Enterococcus sp. DIV0187]